MDPGVLCVLLRLLHTVKVRVITLIGPFRSGPSAHARSMSEAASAILVTGPYTSRSDVRAMGLDRILATALVLS